MPIYSANRVGTLDLHESADKHNVCNCFAEALMDVQANDMAIFEAIILSDLREIKALSEGTSVAEDVKALNEEAKKTFWQKILEILAAIKKKIGEIIDGATLKLAEFKAANYSRIVEDFKKNVPEDKYEAICRNLTEKVVVFNTESPVPMPSASNFKSTYEKNKNEENVKASLLCIELLRDAFGKEAAEGKIYSISDFTNAILEARKTERAINAQLIKYAIGQLQDNKSIYDLKQMKKRAFKEIDDTAAEIKKGDAENIANLNAVVTAYQQAIICSTNIGVQLARYSIRNCLKILKVTEKVAKGMDIVNDSAVLAAELNDIDAMAEETMYIGRRSCYSDEVIAEAVKIVAEAEAKVEADACAKNV